MSEEIEFKVRIVCEDQETILDVSYLLKTVLEEVLGEIFDHVGVEETERNKFQVSIGM